MRVKRYIVDTMPEAMQHIRKELGGEAVILSSKEVKVGGFMGLFRTRKIEVIAAVEKEEKQKNTPPTPPMPAAQMPRKAVPQIYKNAASASSTSVSGQPANKQASEPGRLTDREKAAGDFAAALSQAASTEARRSGADSGWGSEPQASPHAIQEQSLPAASKTTLQAGDEVVGMKAVHSSMAEQRMLDELKEMKEWMARISRQNVLQSDLPEPLAEIRGRLSRQDVSPDLADQWITAAVEGWQENGMSWTHDEIRQAFSRQIESFLKGRFGGGLQADTRIVYIAGPTGVGKTTTIAKLAAEQLFKYRRKVGLITADTYRIAAVEQLRTYASILNVPLEVVQSPGDMQRALQRLEDCDLILMDTAGRNYRNELLVSELQSMLSPGDASETYLVLSMTSKRGDMLEITEHFSKFGLDKVIFTKLDETGSFGAMFDVLDAYPSLNLSYMTNGQNVPDDLLMPDTRMLLDLLLGEHKP